jgi:hypothetical protein
MNAILNGSLLLMFAALSAAFCADQLGLVATKTDQDGNEVELSMYELAATFAFWIYAVYSIAFTYMLGVIGS